jgi:2',3'-cyclic-nucleotide 2'-phosphodiesterase (5'-nucleotidase family)
MNKSTEDQYSPKQIVRRRDAALLRALKTSSKPHKDMVGKVKRAKAPQLGRVNKVLNGHTVEYYMERARLARERATLLIDRIAKDQEIKLAESYEELARDMRQQSRVKKT